jgi:predicted RNA binding protein YcfA (HicA-like mRNA interferase family)
MEKLPRITASEAIKALKRAGFFLLDKVEAIKFLKIEMVKE